MENYPFESIQGERVLVVVVVSADVFKHLVACNEIHSLNIQSLWFYSICIINWSILSNNSPWAGKWKDKKILKWMRLIYMLMQTIRGDKKKILQSKHLPERLSRAIVLTMRHIFQSFWTPEQPISNIGLMLHASVSPLCILTTVKAE